MKAMDKDRTRRYASPSELALDIQRHLDHEPVMAGAPSTKYRMGKFVRRHKIGVVATGFALAALLVGLAGTTYGLVRATRAEAEVRQEAETAKQVSDFLVGLFQVSDPLHARGETITAREILDRGVEQIEGALEDQPRVRARLMGTMGHVYMNLGLWEPSRPLQEQSLAQHRELLGDEHPETLGFMHSLALLYSRQGLFREAESLHLEALENQKRTFGEDASQTLLSMTSLALVYASQGRYDEAEASYREALEIQRRTLGDDAVDVLDTMNGLADLYRQLGRYDEAEPLYPWRLSRASGACWGTIIRTRSPP
jgi:tetratricopeptide (TPR) repeat protein